MTIAELISQAELLIAKWHEVNAEQKKIIAEIENICTDKKQVSK